MYDTLLDRKEDIEEVRGVELRDQREGDALRRGGGGRSSRSRHVLTQRRRGMLCCGLEGPEMRPPRSEEIYTFDSSVPSSPATRR